jgi:hypothetical protein
VNTSAAPCPRGDTGVISAAAASTVAPIVLRETVIIHLSYALLRRSADQQPTYRGCDHHLCLSIAVFCRMPRSLPTPFGVSSGIPGPGVDVVRSANRPELLLVLDITALIFAVVFGLIAYTVVRYRRRAPAGR